MILSVFLSFSMIYADPDPILVSPVSDGGLPLTAGPEDENDGQLTQQKPIKNQFTVRLQGFGGRDYDPRLIFAFQEFIDALDPNTTFPIKISRTKRWNGPNEYYIETVMHNNSVFWGSKESNRSIGMGMQKILSDQQLTGQLDGEAWISKIIITPEENPGHYIVQKFGVGHSVYRGAANTTKAAELILPTYTTGYYWDSF
nr:uncharacterized protein [uncultured bacterium]